MDALHEGQRNVNLVRLNALRQNLPSLIDEEIVRDCNSMVLALQVTSHDENLVHFRIPDTELKPRIVSVQMGSRRFPGRTNYSEDKYCDSDLFERQIQGLWSYIQESDLRKKKESEPVRATHGDEGVWALVHPEVVKVSKTRFDTQHFADAAEAAFKLINERVKSIVRERIGSECDGAPLMQKAFSARQACDRS